MQKITKSCAKEICKTIRSIQNPAGGGKLVVSEQARNNLMMCGHIVKEYACISRNIDSPTTAIIFVDTNKLEVNETQIQLEEDYDNSLVADFFKTVSRRGDEPKGWKSFEKDIMKDMENIHGDTTKSSL